MKFSFPVFAVGSVALLLFLLERFFPLRKSARPLVARLIVNIALSAAAFGVAIAFVQPAARYAGR